MNVIFDKRHLDKTFALIRGEIGGRGLWDLATDSDREKGLLRMPDIIDMLLSKGANEDPWCACELGRRCFTKGSNRLPLTLSLWKRAILSKDEGAIWDVRNRDILKRIYEYGTEEGRFADYSVKCAMLAEYTLTDLGLTDWNGLYLDERVARVQTLVDRMGLAVGFPTVRVVHEVDPMVGEIHARGYAMFDGTYSIVIADSVFYDYPDLITVIFHEYGHLLQYYVSDYGSGNKVFELINVPQSRINTWFKGVFIPGYEGSVNSTHEEDADTLSYNVLLAWATMFA